MDENEIPYMLNVLQMKSTEMFQQSLVYESKFQRQNDIITKQNEALQELQRSNQELTEQVQNLDSKLKGTRKRKTTTSDDTF